MTIPLPRLVRAFLAAAGVALAGTAVGQAVLGAATGGPGSWAGLYVIVLFGWPFAFAAALAAVPVYLVLARLGRVTRRAAVGAGAAVGVVAGLFLLGAPLLALWSVAVGALAGRAWWGVAAGPHAA